VIESLPKIVRKAESNYLQGKTKLGDYVERSQHEVVQTVDAYLNSKHTSGETDSLGRPKPFFNIVTAAVNIWYRATDLDRKNIKFIPTSLSAKTLAFVASILLQNWMDKYRFGQFLNSWGRSLAKYGSSVVKFVEKGGELIPSVIPWNRLIVDPVDFDALPRIEKFYKTPAQLRRIKEYDQDAVNSLISAVTTRKTLFGSQKDNQNEFIELYEVHGELDSRLLDKEPNLSVEDKDIRYIQQMHVISFVKNDKEGYNDFNLYKGKESKDPYMLTHLIEEDGQTLSIGAVESLFDAQWMVNHTIKNMKDTLDITSKLIMQTADPRYTGRNVLSGIESGDIFTHEINMPLTRIANDKPDITALQGFSNMWQAMGRELTGTPEAMRGIMGHSQVAYRRSALEVQQAQSLFEIMTENKGLDLEDMLRIHIIPNLKKQLKHKDEIVGILDDAGITEIDAMYIPKEAIKRYNQRIKNAILDINAPIPSPFDQQAEEGAVKQGLGVLGNKRFFTPDDLGKLNWDELFSDFEWDNIRVEITNENVDKQDVLQTLNMVLTTIAKDPSVLQDPNAKMLFNAILTETGRISPLQLTAPPPPQAPANRVSESISFRDLPPDGQAQMAAQAGIKLQAGQPVGQPVGAG
jgi:hypothetical protein